MQQHQWKAFAMADVVNPDAVGVDVPVVPVESVHRTYPMLTAES